MSLKVLRETVLETINKAEIVDKADFYLYPSGKLHGIEVNDIKIIEKDICKLVLDQFDLLKKISSLIQEYKFNEIKVSIMDEAITDVRNLSVPQPN